MILDGDSHIYEESCLWEERLSRENRQFALKIEPDNLGYSCLTYQGKCLQVVVPTVPDDPSLSGRIRQRRAAGLPAESGLYDQVPRHYWDVGARATMLDTWGIDEAIVFPQFQGIIESALVHDGVGARANMEAWNRWAIEVTGATYGRLRPVGHLRMDTQLDWVVEQLRFLGDGGVRLAMFVPGLIDGKPPSHPDNDLLWREFVASGVTPVWHASVGHRFVISNADDWEPMSGVGFGMATGMLLRVASQLSLCDMVFNGVFERHPGLQVVISELGVDWLGSFLDDMDLRVEIFKKQQGKPYGILRKKPSEYFIGHVTLIASCPSDRDIETITTSGRGLAFGSDYPHGCGFVDPLRGYQKRLGDVLGALADDFFGDRLAPLVNSSAGAS
jgi:predicted TIM-barrel fold metal-dependent hydrolase